MHSMGIALLVTIITFAIIPSPFEVLGGFACLSNPCVHGVCLDDLNTTYSCYCIDGYTGVQCQTNWDECWSNPCQNGGLCLDGIASFNCSCPAGFVGDVCEEDFNECESNPCLNNGTCQDGANGYTCNCMPGYLGAHCEMDVAVCNMTNDTKCSNGGVCVEGPGVTFSCKCQQGWMGYLCDFEIDECVSNPCQNGAVCIDLHADYECACLFGFSGKNCDEVILVCEDNVCKNNALCLMEDEHPVCYCVPDYHGERCQFQYDECQLGPRCMNGGTCIDGIDNFTCSCPPTLTGVMCECLIIDGQYLDCTYVSPTPMYNVSTESTTETTLFTESTITTTILTTISTTTEADYTSTTEFVPNVTDFITTTTEFDTTTTEPSTILSTTTTEMTTIFSTPGSSSTTEFITEILTSTTPETTITTELSSSTFETSTIPYTTLPSNFTTLPISTTTLLTTTEFIDTTTEEITSTEPTTTTEITTDFSPIFPNVTYFDTTYTTSKGRESNDTLPTTMLTTDHPIIDITSTTEFIDITSLITSTLSTTTDMFTTETTTEDHFTTPPYFLDCSKNENRCQNGGSCVFLTAYGHRCVCTFDTDGPLCEHHLGIKNAAFGGDSFLSHRLYDKSKMAIEFKSKTTSTKGLLFYANIDQTYMALYIESGYLKFKFSCGYQTMLLSELGKPVNNGYDMRINAELTYTENYSHCNASIKLNNTISMSGDQIALVDKFSKINSWLYLGGIPNEYVKDKIQPGFIGCMSNLKLSGRKVNIFKDAIDGFEISECSSLACLSNPCQNNGVCSATAESWCCHCKNGFSGKMCETSVCDNNPCQFGGTCLPHTGSGYICLCPFGKHGHFCENELMINRPYFSSTLHGYSSFIAYPIPKGKFNQMEIKFKISPSTMNQISILMFLGQKGRHDYHSDHMAVSFVKGFIMLTWNLGSGPRRIFTTKPITSGKPNYTIHIGRTSRRAWLYVDSLGNVTGRSPGNLMQLDVIPQMYFGGYESQNFSTLPHDLPLHTGFSGCIFDIEFRTGDIVIPLDTSRQAKGRALGQCGTTECHENICQNNGACLYHGGTFTCLCQDGNFGPLCSSKYNLCDSDKNNCAVSSTCVPMIAGYECDCPIGKTGTFCEKDETLSDINFSGKRSYLSIGPFEFDNLKFNIEFEMRPLKNRGLVFFIGRADMFLSVSLLSGLLELRIMPGRKRLHPNELLVIKSNKLIVLGTWHTIRISVYGRKVYFFVNNIVNTGILQNGEIINLSDEAIYIGGLPDLSLLPNEAVSYLPTSYTGCFRKLVINSRHFPLNIDNIKSSRNIGDCDGTPCGGDFCENGGTCWLDPNLKPHCSCSEPYFGDKCEKVPTCGQKMCQNRGRCSNDRCLCTVGWNGAFCEQSIVVRTPKFYGNGYIVVNKPQKKRYINDNKSIYLNFTTAIENGIILWSQKANKYIGIGVEKGFLKLVYSANESNKIIEVPDINKISDGLFHHLEFNLESWNLIIDNITINMQQFTDKIANNFQHDNVFYLGGVPTHSENYKDARSLFQGSFEGCIESFGTSKDLVIKDFSDFEGENVENCGIA